MRQHAAALIRSCCLAYCSAMGAASPSVEFGHAGFIGGWIPWRPVYWAEELVVDWLGR